jgi:hypothetical protein
MRYILIHAEDSPDWGENFILYAAAASIRHMLTIRDFDLTDGQRVTLSKYLSPPKPVSVVEFDSENDTMAWTIAQTISGEDQMGLFQF